MLGSIKAPNIRCGLNLTTSTAGAAVETSKKATAGTNKSSAHGPTKNLAKLENETEVFEHEKVSTELKKQIQQARLAKKLTQAQLGQLINEKPQIINEYESGKAIPNPQVRCLSHAACAVQNHRVGFLHLFFKDFVSFVPFNLI